MKKILTTVGSLLAILSVVFLVRTLIRNISIISSLQWNIEACLVLIAAVVISLSGVVLLAYGWKILLRGGNVESSFLGAYTIMGRSQIAKYLPGNIFQYVGRVAMGRLSNISPEVTLITIGVETFLIALTAGIIGFIGIWRDTSLNCDMRWLSQTNWFPFSVAGVLIAAALLLSVTFQKVRTWLISRSQYLSPRRVIPVVGLYTIFLMTNGIIIVLLLRYIWNETFSAGWYQYAAGFAIAWLLGFIVPGVPGGIGIREAVFVAIFGSAMGEGLAAGLAILLRVITSISDLLTFAIASWLARKHRVFGS